MRKLKVAGYLRAVELMNGGMTQYEACKKAGISRMTFNKYREMLGEEIAPGKVEVLAKETKPQPKNSAKSKLELLIEENTVMEKNLALKKELGLLQ